MKKKKIETKEEGLSIERNTLIKIIIALAMLFLIVSQITAGKRMKEAYCVDHYAATQGWVSAETYKSYFVVNSNGKTMEFSKNRCSIVG